MEVVKKGLVFAAIRYPYWSLPTIDVLHMRSWICETVY